MANRGLADWEIGLIKRMMEENYARDKMHAYFNRPERTLTPAAFSEIKAKKFGAEISPASPDALLRFVEAFSKSPSTAESDPLGLATLGRLLALEACGELLLESENSHLEFKASFSFQENTFSKIVRAIAALSNNSGGYILCGIEGKTGKVLGLAGADVFGGDLARWSRLLRECLMPVPNFERQIVEVAGKSIGIIYVEAADNKPVVATRKFGEKIRSGAIYYRYPGESAEICYGELAGILNERDRNAQKNILSTVQILSERTPSELAVVDLKGGNVLGSGEPIEISRELVDRLSLIKQGEFVERGGAPAVRVVADAKIAEAANDTAQNVVRGYVSDTAAVRNFALRETVREPLQYFLAGINSSSDWLPLFRWLREAGLTREQAAALVDAEGLTPAKRLRALERLNGSRRAKIPLQRSVRPTRNRLLTGDVPEITCATELRRVMLAVRMVEYVNRDQLSWLWDALAAGFEFAWAAKNGGDLQSYVKAAAARVDELADALAEASLRAA